MAFLFKGGEQLYNEALDAIGRKDYSAARKKFGDAIEKGNSNGGMAELYIALIDLKDNRGSTGAYKTMMDRLGNIQGSSFKFGLTELDVQDFMTECELDVKEIEANGISDNDFMQKGQALISLAGEYATRIGEKNLKLEEICKGSTAATGTRESLILQADGYFIMGKGTVNADPKMAAEYMQMAYNFRKQLGDSGETELKLSKDYAKSCTCWICGRPANAEGIHFMAMRSTIDPLFKSMADKDGVKPINESAESIYVCLPCYTAISNRSDDISRAYYEDAMRELRAVEARLEGEISSMRLSVSLHR